MLYREEEPHRRGKSDRRVEAPSDFDEAYRARGKENFDDGPVETVHLKECIDGMREFYFAKENFSSGN